MDAKEEDRDGIIIDRLDAPCQAQFGKPGLGLFFRFFIVYYSDFGIGLRPDDKRVCMMHTKTDERGTM